MPCWYGDLLILINMSEFKKNEARVGTNVLSVVLATLIIY